MSNPPQRKFDYPYAARYGTALAESDELTARSAKLRQALRLWLRRLRVVAAVAGALLLVAGGIVAYRLLSQAMFVAELRSHGCEVSFLHQFPGESDPLPVLVRDWLGDDVWSEVAGVSFGENRFGSWWQYRADDIAAICAACGKLDKLRTFSMTSDAFMFDQIEGWPHLDQLEELEINSENLTDADLDRISRLPNLKHLKLTSASVSSGAARQLARLPQLESLELRGIRRADSAAAAPQGFAALTRLVIEGAEIDDAMLVGLGPLPELREAVLSQAQFTDRGLSHLLSGGNVENVVLNDPTNDLDQVAAVRCPEPRSMHLLGAPITGVALQSLAGQEVASLVLDSTAVTDDDLESISRVVDLRQLSLRDTKVTGLGVVHLAALRSLAKLDLTGCPLTHDGIIALTKARLSHLILAKTPLTDEGLLLFENCDTVTQLDITETKVTPAGIKALYQARQRRLQPAGRQESLIVSSDFPEVTEAYVDASRLRASGVGNDLYDPGN